MTPQYLLKPARLAGSPLLATQSDERLVDLVRAGSEPAFEAIVTRYRGQLLRYCAAIVGRERAEDAIQQTFVNAFTAIQRDEKKLNLKPWLYRIAHNASLNALRDSSPSDLELDPDLDLAGGQRPDLALEQREEFAAVVAAVESLPPRQRDAILLRELEGRSYEEISSALDVGGGSVRALLNRARNSVRLAATAVTPVGLLLRIPPGGAAEAGEGVAARVAELTLGAGAGAFASKVGATALVTGAVAGGVALAPGSGDPERAVGKDAPAAESAAPRGVGPGVVVDDESSDGGQDDDGSSRGRGRGGDDDRSGPSARSGPGGGAEDDGEDRSGPGGGEPQAGDAPDGDADRSGSDNSGSGSGSSGSGSGTSGSGSGTSGSGSGTSGSGSGSSGSGSGSPEPDYLLND